MTTPRIVIDKDAVTIEGITVPRPIRMSRSQWLVYWNDEGDETPSYARGYSEGFEDGNADKEIASYS